MCAQTVSNASPVYDEATHTVYYEVAVKGNYTVWLWDNNGHGGDYFCNAGWPGESMTLAGETATGSYVYKFKVTKVSDHPTDVIVCKDGGGDENKVFTGTLGSDAVADYAPVGVASDVVYELNVGAFTTEGTFAAAATQLDRLKALGVDVIWLMPIYPRGAEGINSPYAVKDYQSVNPNYGTLADLKNFVSSAHDKGMKVWLDWVPNHTATDHPWVNEHPEYYVQDGSGNLVHPNNYGDVYQLNYQNSDLQAAMNAAMSYWITETGIDGFRNDYVSSTAIPESYWTSAIASLKTTASAQGNDAFSMLAEADLTTVGNARLQNSGFDYDYAMTLHGNLTSVGASSDGASLKSALKKFLSAGTDMPFSRMTYLTNHDVNFNGDGATLQDLYGDNRYPLTVFTFTVNGMPLIYNGQEIGGGQKLDYFNDDQAEHPEADIDWETAPDITMQSLITTLTTLKHQQSALAHGSNDYSKTAVLSTSDNSVVAYARTVDDESVLVLLNLGGSDASVTVSDLIFGTYQPLLKGNGSGITTTFDGTEQLSNSTEISVAAHGFSVYKLENSQQSYVNTLPTIVYVRDTATPSQDVVTLYSWFNNVAGNNVEPFGSWGDAQTYPTYTRYEDGEGNVWLRYVINDTPEGGTVNVIAVADGKQTDNLSLVGGTQDNYLTINSTSTKDDGHFSNPQVATFTEAQLASLTLVTRTVRVYVQDSYAAVPHLYAWYTDPYGDTQEPMGGWGQAITQNNYSKYKSSVYGSAANYWYAFNVEVPDGLGFHAIAASGGTQVDEWVPATANAFYIAKNGDTSSSYGSLTSSEEEAFVSDATTKDIDVYVRDTSGAIVHLYGEYTKGDGTFEYAPLGDKASAFNTNLEVCLSDVNNSDGQHIWYHYKFRDVKTEYGVRIIAYANGMQVPVETAGADSDIDNYYVASAENEVGNKTVLLVINTRDTESPALTEKDIPGIVLYPQGTKNYKVYVRKANPTAEEAAKGEYVLNLYAWYNIDANVTTFQPAGTWPGTEIVTRYVDDQSLVWYRMDLTGIPYELYDNRPNSTLYAIVHQNGDEDKSNLFNITESTPDSQEEIFLIYNGAAEDLTQTTKPARLDTYPPTENGSFYLVSPELTGNAKLPQFRFTPSRNRSMNGQDGQINYNLQTLNIKDDEIAKRIAASGSTTIHYHIERGDGNTSYDFRPRQNRRNYELGSGNYRRTLYGGAGGTGYTYEKYNWNLSRGTSYEYTLTQGTGQSYTFFIGTTSTQSDTISICINRSIVEDAGGYYLIGNIDNTIGGASWSPANANARMLMIRNEYLNPNDEAVTDSIVYTVTVPRPTNGWGDLYLAVSPKTPLADNEWSVGDWAYVIRPQVEYQKDGLATEGGLFAHGAGVSSGDQSFNPSQISDIYESFTFSMNITTSTYRFILNRGLFVMGDALTDKIDPSSGKWDAANARQLSYDEDGRYWYINNLYLTQGQPLRFANDKVMTNCFVENDYRPLVPGTADGKKGPENGREETQYVNIVKWRNEGRNNYDDLTESQQNDDITFLLPSGSYNIRFYIRSKVENLGSNTSGNVSNDEYYIFYVIDPAYNFVGVNKDVTILNPLTDTNGDEYHFYKPFSSYHAMNVPEGVDVFYIKSKDDGGLNVEERTVALTKFTGDIIPRNTGVVLASKHQQDNSTNKTLPVNFTTADDPWEGGANEGMDGNLLKPVLESTHLSAQETTGEYNYIFGYKKLNDSDDGVTLGYYVPGSGNAQANSSYLQITDDLWPDDDVTAKVIKIMLWNDILDEEEPTQEPDDTNGEPADGETMGVNSLTGDTNGNQPYYTLGGTRLDSRPTAKGIYVHGGKKIIIR